MKKLYTSFLLIVCIIALSVPLSLAEIETPWNNKEMRIQLIERFRKLDQKLVISNENDEFSCFVPYDSTYGKYEWKNGAFVHYDGDASGDWFAYNSSQIAELGLESFSKAQGFGCYVENNSASSDLKLGFTLNQSEDNFFIISSSAGGMYYATADGTKTGRLETDESWGQSAAIIEPGFKGYIIVPFTSLKNQQTGQPWDSNRNYLTQIGFIFLQSIANEGTGENTLIDNIFLYGKNVTDNNDGFITGALAYPAPASSLSASSAAISESSINNFNILYMIMAGIIITGICFILFLLLKKRARHKS